MEIITDLLIKDGVSSALIVVLIFIWRDISRISKKVDSFNGKIYRNGNPIYQSVKECGAQMAVCRKDINDLDFKVHQNATGLVRAEMRLDMLEAHAGKTYQGA